MAEGYSQLEVAHSEHVQSSPEVVNYSTFAPEAGSPPHDAPEVAEHGHPLPQRSLSHQSPELGMKQWRPESSAPTDSSFAKPDSKVTDSDWAPETKPPQPEKEATVEGGSTKVGFLRKHGILFWVAVGVFAFLVIVIGVGVGAGVGIRNRNAKSHESISSAIAPAPSNTTLPHGLSNDTSLAVITLEIGDKRWFFQESSGRIREALYTSSTEKWIADTNNIVATDAKNSTPLSALVVNNTGISKSAGVKVGLRILHPSIELIVGAKIYIFYITSDNHLASRQFLSGTWVTRDNFSPSGSGTWPFATQKDTRALAVTASGNSSEGIGAYVFSVASNGTAVCLNLNMQQDSISASPGPTLPASLEGGNILALAAGEASVGRPQVGVLTSKGAVYYNLYFSFLDHGAWGDPKLQTILVPPLPAGQQIKYPSTLTLSDAYPATTAASQAVPTATTNPSGQTAAYNESLIGDVNIAQVFVDVGSSKSYTLFGFWVNGTSLAAYTTKNIGLSTQPTSEFPFSRLAGTTSGNSSQVYLYHQINQTVIAEDMYNTDGGFFTSSYFDIASS